MPQKILYFDTETTGLNPITCGLIQFSCIIEIDGKPLSKENMHIAPFDTDLVEPSALAINGHSVETIKSFEPPLAAHHRLVKSLSRYVDQFNPTDKFFIAGYNVGFDLDFLANWFKKCNDQFLGAFINWIKIDPLPFLHHMHFTGKLNLPNYKLATVCKHFAIPLTAHDAMCDIEATRSLIVDKLKLTTISHQNS